jgi:hypothetical protein
MNFDKYRATLDYNEIRTTRPLSLLLTFLNKKLCNFNRLCVQSLPQVHFGLYDPVDERSVFSRRRPGLD